MKNIRLLFTTLICLVASFVHAADDVEFRCEVSSANVVVGQAFRISYVINQTAREVRMPELTDFTVVAGPSQSTNKSMSFVNGKMSSSQTFIVSYMLEATKQGKFTIPSGTAIIDGKPYKSNAVSVNVLPQEQVSQSGNGNGVQQVSNPQVQSTGTATLSNEDVFVSAAVSRTNVYEQEALMLTYKLCYRTDIRNIEDVKLPELKGFAIQEIDVDPNAVQSMENINGKNYHTYIIKKYLLFPQKSGKLTIDPMQITVEALVVTGYRRSFFGREPVYESFKKSMRSKSVSIDVKELPNKPSDFCGGVGVMSLISEIDKTELSANESLTIKVKLSGKGNLKMVKLPGIVFPADFEVYEPTTTTNFNYSTEGLSGTKTIEYLVIPRHGGDFKIKGFSVSYFDSNTKQYKTLSVPDYDVKVSGSAAMVDNGVSVTYADKEQVKALASDLRYIKVDGVQVKPRKAVFTGTLGYWLALTIPAFITLLLIIFFRKQAKENADLARVRAKKANKVALKRLKLADVQLKAGNKERFYDEILNALWGYTCDKLSMPLAELNKENVAQKLQEHGVEDELTNRFLKLLNDCEFERFAPLQNSQAAMDNIFSETINLISQMENSVIK